MKKNLLMTTVLACAVLSAMAGNGSTDSLRTYELQSVQVVSTRANKKTPVAYSTLNQNQIKQLNFGLDVPYILSLSPSVTTTSDAGNGIGYTSIRVRGVDPSRINITANGIPLNDAESSQVYFVNMGDFASSVQSMQLQRGAGTSTNGSGAFGATLNMQTENIGVKPFIGLDASAGSYYSHKETLRFGTGLLGGHWGLQGRLSNIGSKGYLDRASTKLNSYFLQAGYFGDNTMVKFLTFNGTERTYHAWNYASKYEQELYGRRFNSCGLYYDAQGNMRYYDGQTDNYHQQNYQLIWDQLLNNHWNFNVAFHYTKGQGYYEEYKSDRSWADYGLAENDKNVNITDNGTTYFSRVMGDLVRQKKMDNDFYGAIASINYDNKKNLTATLGAGWNRYDGKHFGRVTWESDAPYLGFYSKSGDQLYDADGNAVTRPYTNTHITYPDFEYYRNEAWKSDFNVYAKAAWTFLPGLNAYVDLQYRHVGFRLQDPGDWYGTNPDNKLWAHDDFDFFNPKAGLNYQADSHNRFYASYAVSHKEPTRNDYQNNYVNHLKAEKLQDWELGYRYESPRFTAGVNLYYMYYNHQYVLTGELDDIGEMKASNDNSGKSYREGIELEGAWKPCDFFRWDINATFARSINKDWTVSLDDGKAVNLGDTHTAFSPDFILNNILTFNYSGFNASVQSQYISKQYLTNTDFDSYNNYVDGKLDRTVGMTLKSHFNTNLNLSYHFQLKQLGLKEAAVGMTLYNLFNAKYDNNGWAAPKYRTNANGAVEAYCNDDLYEAGFAPSAPFNWMAHLSLTF